jgi:hypothetical protein
MKLTIYGNKFVLIAMGVFSSFRRHNYFKVKFTWKFQESLYYLWIVNVQKASQIHLKRPPDVPSCPTEQGPGAWGIACIRWRHNVTMAKNRFYVNVFFTRRSLISCALLCVQTHTVYLAYFRSMDSDLSSGVMLSVLSCLVLLDRA